MAIKRLLNANWVEGSQTPKVDVSQTSPDYQTEQKHPMIANQNCRGAVLCEGSIQTYGHTSRKN